jgi:Tol biopolymer transport system component
VWSAVAAVALVVGAAAALEWNRRYTVPAPEMRLDIDTPPTADPTSMAISPDGSMVVVSVIVQGRRQLWVRPLNDTTSRPLPGTDDGRNPFWSPDSRSIGFFSTTKLQRVDLDGGAPRALANVVTPAGGTWNRDGTILYVPNSAGTVYRISAEGGETVPNAKVDDPATRGQRFPNFLPDGRHFLVHAGGAPSSGIYVGELGSAKMRRVLAANSTAVYVAGYILFARQATLFAQPFDLDTLDVHGSPTRVADDIIVGGGFGGSAPALSASSTGVIAFRTGTARVQRRLVWFDRTGRELGSVGGDRRSPSNPGLSPDGRTLVLQDSGVTGQASDIWLLDLERRVDTRLTFDPSIDAAPTWSPDGSRIVFNSNRRGAGQYSDLYVKNVTGSGSEEPFLMSENSAKFACDWSPDGRFILYRSVDPTTGAYDLMAVPVEGDRKPVAVAQTPYDERDGQFAPDGQWIAYQSDESGRPEIYVQPFLRQGQKVRVSVAGGTQARWRRDGKELFYLSAENQLMEVPVARGVDGAMMFGTPVALFATHAVPVAGVLRQQYVVTTDGSRFLINVAADEANTSPMTILLNWQPARQIQ